jgi:hypothetical protein
MRIDWQTYYELDDERLSLERRLEEIKAEQSRILSNSNALTCGSLNAAVLAALGDGSSDLHVKDIAEVVRQRRARTRDPVKSTRSCLSHLKERGVVTNGSSPGYWRVITEAERDLVAKFFDAAKIGGH